MINHLIIKSGFVGIVTLSALVLDETTAVPVAAAIVVAVAWGRGLWWLGRRFQSLEDGLKIALEDRAEAKEVMASLVAKVNSLRCNNDDCPVPPKGRLDRERKQ